MKDYLRSIVEDSLKQFDLPDEDLPEIQIERPNQPEHGDAATNVAMMLAKPLRDNPRAIAGRIVEKLNYTSDKIATVEIAGPGFINFRYADGYLFEQLAAIIHEGADFGRTGGHKGKKIQVEFVSANPTGPLTVGHGRNAVLGDTIARLLEWTGAEVEREYYFNDAGRQMRVLGESVRARCLELLGEGVEFPEDGYQGEYIKKIAQDFIAEKNTPNDPTANRVLSKLRGESRDEVIQQFAKFAKGKIFEDIQQTLNRMSIKMDSFFNERDLYEDGSIDKIVKTFRDKDLVYDEDGATWFKTTRFGKDKDTVLIKSSGEPTYRLPDIAYHADKLERGYDLCIDVFGADHIDTYPDVLSGLEALGYDTSKVDVVVYQFVTIVKEGKPFKMSTRKANFVTLDELMDEVGPDVTRFFFLMRAPNTHLEFDIAEAKEAGEKNPVFYLQYAHARIKSILRKVGEEHRFATDFNPGLLTHPSELQLIKTMIRFPEMILSAADSREPHRLINFLNDLASDFTTFYHDCRILGEKEELVHARAELSGAVAQVLANGLGILGITAPEQM